MNERIPLNNPLDDTVVSTKSSQYPVIGPGEVYRHEGQTDDIHNEPTYPIDTHMGRRIFDVAMTGDTSDKPLSCPIEQLEPRYIFDSEATLLSGEREKIEGMLASGSVNDESILRKLNRRKLLITTRIEELKKLGSYRYQTPLQAHSFVVLLIYMRHL